MKKSKFKKFNIEHWSKVALSFVLAVGFSYLLITVYIHYSNAGVFKLSNYIGKIDIGTPPNQGYPECPKLMKVEGSTGAIIIRDECTNLYWNRLDLPLRGTYDDAGTEVVGDREGYTWQEANQYCEDLATIPIGGGSTYKVFRLPTADELLSLTYTPCVDGANCTTPPTASPVTDKTATFVDADGNSDGNILPTPSDKYFYKTSAGIKFAEGAYWTRDELDVNGDLSTLVYDNDGNGTLDSPYEAASSVNLAYGTINNPVFGKDVRLNVRCILDNPIDVRNADVTSTNYNINELQWWAEGNSASCSDGSKKLKLGRRKNLIPKDGVDVNKCPEGYNDALTGDFALCTGVTEPTQQCQYFSCPSGKDYVKNSGYTSGTDSPIKCQ